MQIDVPAPLAPVLDAMPKEDIRRVFAVGLFLLGHLSLPQAAALAHLEESALRRHLEARGLPIR